MTVRANKQLISRDIYEEKATKWLNLWPKLTVIPWENEQATIYAGNDGDGIILEGEDIQMIGDIVKINGQPRYFTT